MVAGRPAATGGSIPAVQVIACHFCRRASVEGMEGARAWGRVPASQRRDTRGGSFRMESRRGPSVSPLHFTAGMAGCEGPGNRFTERRGGGGKVKGVQEDGVGRRGGEPRRR